MPTDLLLPAFALTLVANAVLIALAIRSLHRVRTDAPPTREWLTPAPAARPSASVARPRDETPEPPVGDGAGTPSFSPAPRSTLSAGAPVAAQPDPVTESGPQPATPARARASRQRATPRSAAPTSSPSPGAESPTRRGRRKFSMPPIDDDHEKVTRSIESFLAGSDGPVETSGTAGTMASANDGEARSESAPGGRARVAGADGPSTAPTTIALVAIAGLDSSSDGPDAEGIDPVAMLERTLRGAARGGDEVHQAGYGRFRVVLPATGELAARAYLRRIRATVEPQLEAAERPLQLVVATATALNVPIRSATITARRRLEAALGAQPVGAGRAGAAVASAGDKSTTDEDAADGVDHTTEPKPRAAGD